MDAAEYIKNHIDGSRLVHSYIVTGGTAGGRMEAAKYIASAALCEKHGAAPCGVCKSCVKVQRGVHPDITVTVRDEDAKELTVDAMRAVRSAANVMPNEADRSVYIIAEADTMNTPAQNAMLKIFEEPPRHAVFVLAAANPERLLGTVRSRCETITLPPEDDFVIPLAAAELMDCALRGDRVGVMRSCVQLEKLPRNELADAVTGVRMLAVRQFREGRISEDRLEAISGAADRAEKYMAFNVSAGYISGVFMTALV